MDIMSIFAMIAKGVSVAEMLLQAGKDVVPAIQVIKNLVTGAQEGGITQTDLDTSEAQLDALINEFNEPI